MEAKRAQDLKKMQQLVSKVVCVVRKIKLEGVCKLGPELGVIRK